MWCFRYRRWWVGVVLTVLVWSVSSPLHAARLKDVVDIEGVRANQLIGFGLIAGLNGTGDSKNGAAFTTQSLVMMLERMGISAQDVQQQISVKNVASVMVTASLPAFARQGSRLDVVLSSLGDAKSLEGGTLILTPMKGADGRIYAVAQGAISIGGIEPQGGGATQGGQKNHPTVGRISGGAVIEREVQFDINQEKSMQLALRNPDFTTANRVAQAVNTLFGQRIAQSRDSGTVVLELPTTYQDRVVEFVSRLENLQVDVDVPARIVVNERTGTIVMGENVRISTVVLSHGNLNVRIQSTVGGRQIEGRGRVMEMEEAVTLGDLVSGLNTVGASPKDLIAILQAIKAAGALQADMEIL